MGIGTSIILMAAGAIMAFAVEVDTEGFNINTVGLILMVAGAIGLIASLLVFGPRSRRTEVVGDGRTVYHDEV